MFIFNLNSSFFLNIKNIYIKKKLFLILRNYVGNRKFFIILTPTLIKNDLITIYYEFNRRVLFFIFFVLQFVSLLPKLKVLQMIIFAPKITFYKHFLFVSFLIGFLV